MCALPVGAIVGEVFAGPRLGSSTRERIALPLVCLTLLPYPGYALHPGLPVALLLLLLSGIGSAYSLGLDQWLVRDVPEELRGRAMTLLSAGRVTVQGAGMALARRPRPGVRIPGATEVRDRAEPQMTPR